MLKRAVVLFATLTLTAVCLFGDLPTCHALPTSTRPGLYRSYSEPLLTDERPLPIHSRPDLYRGHTYPQSPVERLLPGVPNNVVDSAAWKEAARELLDAPIRSKRHVYEIVEEAKERLSHPLTINRLSPAQRQAYMTRLHEAIKDQKTYWEVVKKTDEFKSPNGRLLREVYAAVKDLTDAYSFRYKFDLASVYDEEGKPHVTPKRTQRTKLQAKRWGAQIRQAFAKAAAVAEHYYLVAVPQQSVHDMLLHQYASKYKGLWEKLDNINQAANPALH